MTGQSTVAAKKKSSDNGDVEILIVLCDFCLPIRQTSSFQAVFDWHWFVRTFWRNVRQHCQYNEILILKKCVKKMRANQVEKTMSDDLMICKAIERKKVNHSKLSNEIKDWGTRIEPDDEMDVILIKSNICMNLVEEIDNNLFRKHS